MSETQVSGPEDICNYTFRDILTLKQSIAVSHRNENWPAEEYNVEFSTKSHNVTIELSDSKIVFFIVSYLLVLIIALLVWAIHKDNNNKKRKKIVFLPDNIPNQNYTYFVMLQSGSTSTSKVIIKLEGENRSEPHILQDDQQNVMGDSKRTWFLLNTVNSLGELNYLHMWMDYVGPMPGWFCDKIVVLDIQRGQFWEFEIYESFSPSFGTNYRAFSPIGFPELNHSCLYKKIKHIKELWKEHHILISLARNHSLCFVTYFQKVCITGLYLIILSCLLVLNFYFKPFGKTILHEQFHSSEALFNICVGILITLIPFVITCLVSLIFTRINTKRKEGTNLIKIIIQGLRCCLPSKFLTNNIAKYSRDTQQKYSTCFDSKRYLLADSELNAAIGITEGIMFENILTGKKCKYLAYVIIISTITTLSYVSMLFGSDFNWIISYYFFITFVMAIIFCIAVLESIKIVLILLYNAIFILQRTNVKENVDILQLKDKALKITKMFSNSIRSINYKRYQPTSMKKLKKFQKHSILAAYTKICIFDFTSSFIILFIILMFMTVINYDLCFYTNTENLLEDLESKNTSVGVLCYNNCITILKAEKVYPYKLVGFPVLDNSQSILGNFSEKQIDIYSYYMLRTNYKHILLTDDVVLFYNNKEEPLSMFITVYDCFSGLCFGYKTKTCLKRNQSAVLLSILIVLFPIIVVSISSCVHYTTYKFIQQNKFYKTICNSLNVIIIVLIGVLLFLFIHLNMMASVLDINDNCNYVYKLLKFQSNLSTLRLLIVILLIVKILFIFCKRYKSKCLLLNISFDISTIFQVSVVCLSFLLGLVAILQFVLASLAVNFYGSGNNAFNLVINLILNLTFSNKINLISKLQSSLSIIQISLIITYVIFVRFIKFSLLFLIIKLLSINNVSVKDWLKKDLLSYSYYFGKDTETMTHNDNTVLIQALVYSMFNVNKSLKYLIEKKIKCNNDLLIIMYGILSIVVTDSKYLEYRNKDTNTARKLYPPYHILLRNYKKKWRVAVIKTSIQILTLEKKLNAVIALMDTIC